MKLSPWCIRNFSAYCKHSINESFVHYRWKTNKPIHMNKTRLCSYFVRCLANDYGHPPKKEQSILKLLGEKFRPIGCPQFVFILELFPLRDVCAEEWSNKIDIVTGNGKSAFNHLDLLQSYHMATLTSALHIYSLRPHSFTQIYPRKITIICFVLHITMKGWPAK